MVDIDVIVNITLASDLLSIEENIDKEILQLAKEGRSNYSIIIAKEAKGTYEKYKKVTEKYKDKYNVSYGFNHNKDYLIIISWYDKIKERMSE